MIRVEGGVCLELRAGTNYQLAAALRMPDGHGNSPGTPRARLARTSHRLILGR